MNITEKKISELGLSNDMKSSFDQQPLDYSGRSDDFFGIPLTKKSSYQNTFEVRAQLMKTPDFASILSISHSQTHNSFGEFKNLRSIFLELSQHSEKLQQEG